MTHLPRPIGIVFDLDDTLYLERDYAFSGFSAVAEWLERTRGIGGFEEQARIAFAAGERKRVFDAALTALRVDPTPTLITALVQTYRSHRPDIRLAEDTERFLARWPADQPLALLTDGFHQSQRNKVAALGLDAGRFDPIVYTDEWGAEFWKPHQRGFDLIAGKFGLPPTSLAYIADNPAKDFMTPRALGWRTVRIDRPQGVHSHEPAAAGGAAAATVETLDDLEQALSLAA
jgi:putative hydrolase of the HAD superfamily